MNRTTSTMLAMLLGYSMVWATPTNNPDVTGYIVDENNQPLEFVNIALLSLNDSTYVQGATSDVDGKFHIVTPETVGILRITYVGYETRYVNVENIEAGRIILRSDAKMLDDVTVKGQLPKTKLTGNSMVTTIEGTVLGSSGSAKEMLSKVPGMTQKGDDLEVLGKGTPIYYINGRKMQDKEELKRLRSEEIQSVEVITNPGAEYDATVFALRSTTSSIVAPWLESVQICVVSSWGRTVQKWLRKTVRIKRAGNTTLTTWMVMPTIMARWAKWV